MCDVITPIPTLKLLFRVFYRFRFRNSFYDHFPFVLFYVRHSRPLSFGSCNIPKEATRTFQNPSGTGLNLTTFLLRPPGAMAPRLLPQKLKTLNLNMVFYKNPLTDLHQNYTVYLDKPLKQMYQIWAPLLYACGQERTKHL